MTNAMPASAGEPAVHRRLLDELRDVPVRFAVLAGAAALLVLAGALVTPVDPYFLPVDPVDAFLGAMWRLGHVCLVAAPLVALLRPGAATALAVLPTPVVLFGANAWPFVWVVALVSVAMVTVWRSPARAVAPAGTALLGIGVLLTGRTVMVMPYGAEIGFGYQGRGAADRLTVLAMYLAAVLLALAIAWWMRSGVVTARRAAALESRSAAVEDRAAVLGERARLACDLHDVVAHHVSLIAVRAETAPYTHPDLSPEARRLLDAVAADARRALDELRGVLGVLRRAEDGAGERTPQPQLADVAALVATARAAGEDVSLSGPLDLPVGSAQQYVAYRVVQEALTNARRHAPGQPVAVDVAVEGGQLRVLVTTPYVVPTPAREGAGHGLSGMRERVEALGGRLRAEVDDRAFVVEATLPRGTR